MHNKIKVKRHFLSLSQSYETIPLREPAAVAYKCMGTILSRTLILLMQHALLTFQKSSSHLRQFFLNRQTYFWTRKVNILDEENVIIFLTVYTQQKKSAILWRGVQGLTLILSFLKQQSTQSLAVGALWPTLLLAVKVATDIFKFLKRGYSNVEESN